MRSLHGDFRMTALSAPMSPRDQALKRATHALVAAAGGCEQAPGFCRVGKSQLAAAGSITEPDRWLTVDVLRDLQAVTHGHADQTAVLRLLAADAGCVLVPLAAVPIDPLTSIGALSKEASELVSVLAQHAAGGECFAADIVREADDLVRLAAGVRAAAAAIAKGVAG
jgi:hypothetical protein